MKTRRPIGQLANGWHRSATLSKAFALAIVTTLGWLAVVSTPASAHGFTVGILVTPGTGSSSELAFIDGFRLAVDQSPDVSHAPGTNAGDHLGGLDVELIVVNVEADPGAAINAAISLADRAEIVVADVPPGILEAIFAPVRDSGTLLITTTGAETADFPDTPYFFGAGTPGAYGELLSRRSGQTAELALRQAYGSDPSAAAIRGYHAARLIDLAVEATFGRTGDSQAMQKALAEANNSAVPATGSTESTGVTATQRATPVPATVPGPSAAGFRLAIATGVASLIVLAWWLIRTVLLGR